MYKLYQKTRISTKFYSISAVFLLPIIFLLIYTINGFNGYIKFAEDEQKGVWLLKRINRLMVALPELQINFLLNSKHNNQTLIDTLENHFDELIKLCVEYEQSIKVSKASFKELSKEYLHPEEIKSQFQKLKQSLIQNNSNAEQLFTSLYNNIFTLNSRIGDVSNLILDPDLDSYYLMDAALLALPQTQARITNLRLFLLNNNNIIDNLNERIKLVNYSTLFQQSDLDRIVADYDVTFQEDGNFYGVSPTLKQKLPSQLDNLCSNLNNIIEKLSKSESQSFENNQIFHRNISSTIKSINDLWSTSLLELNSLLSIRINSYKYNRFIIIAISIILIIIAYFVLLYTASLIKNSFKVITFSIESIAKGNIIEAENEINKLLRSRE